MLRGVADRFRVRAILFGATTLSGAPQAEPNVGGNIRIDDNLRQRRRRRRSGCLGRLFGSYADFLGLGRIPGVLYGLRSDLRLLDGVSVFLAGGALADSNEGNSERLLEVRNVDGFTHVRAGGVGPDTGADDEAGGIGVFVGRIVAVVVARKLLLSHFVLSWKK